jgi:cellulose synthase/poly-beta-1,6-N-acetylglucosamine synthase-like glycosyltransferase
MVHALIIVSKKPNYLKSTIKLREKQFSILVPCYNEENIIKTTILGIEQLNYGNYEFILINDGSLDHTFEIMARMLDLEMQPPSLQHILEFSPIKGVYRSKKNPRVIVIDKMNGGKADSLNAGISYASSEIVITLDADSLLDETALTMINRAFEDENLIAAGGTVHVLQGRKFNKGLLKPTLKVKPIVKFQIFEYLRGFYIYKASLAKADALSIISGAFGIFKKDVLLAVGGYRKTVGEDIDITLKVQNYKNKRKGLKVAYIPEAVCYTEVPETWKDFYKQRIRWQKAFVDCLILYFKELILTIFTKPLSFFFLVDAFLVGIVSSYITVLGFVLILLFFGYTKLMIILTVISLSISLLYNFVSVGISYVYKNGFPFKDLLIIFVFIMLDLFFYRFIALFCTLYGTIQYFISKDDWNKVARTGREYNIEQAG